MSQPAPASALHPVDSTNPLAAPWILCLARADAAAGARLRLWPKVEVGDADPWFWIRGHGGEGFPAAAWWSLPAVRRYAWLAGDRLRPLESRIPNEKLPAVLWQPIDRWFQVSLPVAALPGIEPRPAPLQLVRSSDETSPELLLTSLRDWVRFALAAPDLRLRPLRFAATSHHALIRGQPLPPLPGRRFVVRGCVAVPAGFHWDPPVSAEVLTRRLGVAGDALALWHEDGTFTPLHLEQMVPATRSAIRATASALSLSIPGHES